MAPRRCRLLVRRTTLNAFSSVANGAVLPPEGRGSS